MDDKELIAELRRIDNNLDTEACSIAAARLTALAEENERLNLVAVYGQGLASRVVDAASKDERRNERCRYCGAHPKKLHFMCIVPWARKVVEALSEAPR